jgi:purine nucleosidase
MVPLLLDTDIGTDVDDAIALALAIRHPQIDLRAVTTVTGDASLRARIGAKLLRIAGRDDVEVAAGSATPVAGDESIAWLGAEGEGILEPGEYVPYSSRSGVDVLTERADGATTVATVGPLTNLAAALHRDPAFASRVSKMATMAGALRPVRIGADRVIDVEHNASFDPGATQVALGSGIPILLVPLDVTITTFLSSDDLVRLRRGDPLCRALARMIDAWVPVLRRLARGQPDDVVCALHDPLAVTCTVDTSFVRIERRSLRGRVQDGTLRTVLDPGSNLVLDVVTDVDAPAFRAFNGHTAVGEMMCTSLRRRRVDGASRPASQQGTVSGMAPVDGPGRAEA